MFALSSLTRYPRLGRHWDREEERCLGEVEVVEKESLCGTGHQLCAPRGPFESFSLQELLTASSECREALSEVAYGTSEGGLWWGSANSFLLNLGRCSCLENPHGQRSLVGYSPWSHKELDMTEATELNWTEKRFSRCFGSPSFYPCAKLSDDSVFQDRKSVV